MPSLLLELSKTREEEEKEKNLNAHQLQVRIPQGRTFKHPKQSSFVTKAGNSSQRTPKSKDTPKKHERTKHGIIAKEIQRITLNDIKESAIMASLKNPMPHSPTESDSSYSYSTFGSLSSSCRSEISAFTNRSLEPALAAHLSAAALANSQGPRLSKDGGTWDATLITSKSSRNVCENAHRGQCRVQHMSTNEDVTSGFVRQQKQTMSHLPALALASQHIDSAKVRVLEETSSSICVTDSEYKQNSKIEHVHHQALVASHFEPPQESITIGEDSVMDGTKAIVSLLPVMQTCEASDEDDLGCKGSCIGNTDQVMSVDNASVSARMGGYCQIDHQKSPKSPNLIFESLFQTNDDAKSLNADDTVSSLDLCDGKKNAESAGQSTPFHPVSVYGSRNYAASAAKVEASMPWSSRAKDKPDVVYSPFKPNAWDWRSKSQAGRMGIRSAVRNLEAAFSGSRSASLPKTRQQKHSDNSKSVDRVSPGPHIRPTEFHHTRRDSHSSTSSTSHKTAFPPLPPKSNQQRHQRNSDIRLPSNEFPPHPRSTQCASPSQGSGFFSALHKFAHVPQSQTGMKQGYLQFILRDGVPCYVLTVKDSDEMLLARACAFEAALGSEVCKCMYTFHSGRSKSRGKGGHMWRSWIKKDHKSLTDFAGKMQVSSSVKSDISPTSGEKLHSLVSEFVLFDGRVQDAIRSQSLRFMSNAGPKRSLLPESPFLAGNPGEDNPGSKTQCHDDLRSPRMNSGPFTASQVEKCSPMKSAPIHRSSLSLDVWSDSDLVEPQLKQISSCPSYLEVAAIVIQIPLAENCSENMMKWQNEPEGANDQMATTYIRQPSPYPSIRTLSNRKKMSGLPNDDICLLNAQSVTVMMPNEHHGLPNGGGSGPASLIDRWKSGGKCDCGGWDLGCGMKILSSRRPKKFANDVKNMPLNIYSQGKSSDLVLSLVVVQQGLFILNFQRNISPLKAFATSVAILHSNKSLSSIGQWVNSDDLVNIRSALESKTSSNTVCRVSEGPGACKDVPAWCRSNPPSPFGRA